MVTDTGLVRLTLYVPVHVSWALWMDESDHVTKHFTNKTKSAYPYSQNETKNIYMDRLYQYAIINEIYTNSAAIMLL